MNKWQTNSAEQGGDDEYLAKSEPSENAFLEYHKLWKSHLNLNSK